MSADNFDHAVVRVDFDSGEPIWSIEIYHRTPGADPVWLVALNAPSEDRAKERALLVFTHQGFNVMVIDTIVICPLTVLSELEGGENG